MTSGKAKTYRVSNKDTGCVLFEGHADSPEDALLRAEAEIGGDWAVSIFDDQAANPEMSHFESVRDALKVFVPEAIAYIEIVQAAA